MASITMIRGFQCEGDVLSEEEQISSGELIRIDESIPDDSTDLEVALVLDVSQLKAVYIEVEEDMTLETNNGAVPVDTMTPSPTQPTHWTLADNESGEDRCPVQTDVTALFVTKAATGQAAMLRGRFLVDPTV